MAYEIVCCLELSDALVCHYLTPIARHPSVSRVWIVRSRVSRYAEIPKSEYVLTPQSPKPRRWLRMRKECLRLGERPEVAAFVSFNPIPYGLIAERAARRHGKPMHFGFIGSDWYRDVAGAWGRWTLPTFAGADFLTATGKRMRDEMVARGLAAEKIAVLPHCVDLERFTVAEPDAAGYDFVFVGQLIRRKRVDLILRAFRKILDRYPAARLCIVGDGPRRDELEALALLLELSGAVDFVGYTYDVQRYLADARMVVIASYREGFPFALVEGMCCGLVPVATPVGTIPDLIADGENGLLFEEDDAGALAACLERLLGDGEVYRRLRARVLEMRPDFSYRRATEVWDPWLESLAS
ncbi:MAG: glycosyltransferase [bacterium]|nr:glycosyltransferase [bacterium]